MDIFAVAIKIPKENITTPLHITVWSWTWECFHPNDELIMLYTCAASTTIWSFTHGAYSISGHICYLEARMHMFSL